MTSRLGDTRGSDPIAIAEKLFALLDEGAVSATYKYAVQMALLDLCFEKTSSSGVPPTSLTTREVASKVLELYWHQCVEYGDGHGYLLQNVGGKQTELLKRLIDFRLQLGHASLSRARLAAPDEYRKLLDHVEWKLIEMPLPRLQVFGQTEDCFLYVYNWPRDIKKSVVTRYQRDERDVFDNRLLLRDGVAEALIRLNTLLRPMIRREWLRCVQHFNSQRLRADALEQFLFDRDREALRRVQAPLLELQSSRCFYCLDRISGAADVDHFVPWIRYPNNAIENLVAAHTTCNNNKRDFLAYTAHVARWVERASSRDLRLIATRHQWESDPERTFNVAAALHAQLPSTALVWRGVGDFVPYSEHGPAFSPPPAR